MKNFTTLIGWLLLAAILTVPAILYYNWWSNNKKNEAAIQVPVQSVSTAAIFSSAPAAAPPQAFPQQQDGVRLGRTTVLGTARAAEPPTDQEDPVPPSAPSVRKSVPQNSAPAPTAQEPAAVKAGVARSTAAVQASTATAAQAHVSTQTISASYFDPKTDRDPTITPLEYRKIKEDDALRREDERRQQLALRRQQADSGGERRITLQGIVGNSVIISGEIYTVGSTVHGVKLLKIGANYVIGEYKGKRFRKVLE